MVCECRKGLKYLLLVSLLLLVAATAAFAFNLPGMGKYDKVKPVNGRVTIPVSKVSDGKAHFFKVADGAKEISFFIVKGSDGVLHTAFDACDVCYREKKGYEQLGDKMVCKNCGMKFASVRIGAASSGGCNPSHLPAKIDAANVSITVDDLKTGARFF
uniref:Membrane iron-sulfur containing protein FtrD-like domain-containing protein n=1 Tax=Geobacter sp. (strain M21) TaxID=443144 RepID=C6E3X4_GEOSM